MANGLHMLIHRRRPWLGATLLPPQVFPFSWEFPFLLKSIRLPSGAARLPGEFASDSRCLTGPLALFCYQVEVSIDLGPPELGGQNATHWLSLGCFLGWFTSFGLFNNGC